MFITSLLLNCVSQPMAEEDKLAKEHSLPPQHLYLRVIIIYMNTTATLFSKVLNIR